MKLPPPDKISISEYYEEFQIKTKTFNLESVEKPDMSRYLVHLTGKGELLSILKGKRGSVNRGYLKASLPHYDRRDNTEKVVCFTASPIFALDFFRFKSKSRWGKNHKYGIGFFKLDLISKGVRPIIHTDDELSRTINHLNHAIKEESLDLSCLGEHFKTKIEFLIDQLHNLNFPLLENHPQQGFSWENEWRKPGSHGLTFEHELIKIICCPREETTQIKEALGEYSNKIQFYSNWDEYNEVTDFFKRRKAHLRYKGINRIKSNKDLESLHEIKSKTLSTINNLEKYLATTKKLSSKADLSTSEYLNDLKSYIPKINKQIGLLDK